MKIEDRFEKNKDINKFLYGGFRLTIVSIMYFTFLFCIVFFILDCCGVDSVLKFINICVYYISKCGVDIEVVWSAAISFTGITVTLFTVIKEMESKKDLGIRFSYIITSIFCIPYLVVVAELVFVLAILFCIISMILNNIFYALLFSIELFILSLSFLMFFIIASSTTAVYVVLDERIHEDLKKSLCCYIQSINEESKKINIKKIDIFDEIISNKELSMVTLNRFIKNVFDSISKLDITYIDKNVYNKKGVDVNTFKSIHAYICTLKVISKSPLKHGMVEIDLIEIDNLIGEILEKYSENMYMSIGIWMAIIMSENEFYIKYTESYISSSNTNYHEYIMSILSVLSEYEGIWYVHILRYMDKEYGRIEQKKLVKRIIKAIDEIGYFEQLKQKRKADMHFGNP